MVAGPPGTDVRWPSVVVAGDGCPAKDSGDGICVVGIGASAGGIEALQQFFAAAPVDAGIAYVVIIHLAPDHKSELAPILARCTEMAVHEVTELLPLMADTVYVISPNRKLEITDGSIEATAFSEPRGHRSPIDAFFRSLAAKRARNIAIILSGGGSDGALGARAIKANAGLVMVQDPREAAHDGMPRAAIETGIADLVLPVAEIAARLTDLAGAGAALAPIFSGHTSEVLDEEEEETFARILRVVHRRTGHDFREYKRSTVLRRMARRMQIHHASTLDGYLQLLDHEPDEVHQLFDDLLISVTTFFRDPDAWAALRKQAVEPLLDALPADAPIRAWVPGCATGEEAYTLAIMLCEALAERRERRQVVVFATDVNDRNVLAAREGRYPAAIADDMTDNRLERYFVQEDGGYRVAEEIRNCVVFAVHSLLRDPPFPNLHLISCRNLLIYLSRELQQQMQIVFRYACHPTGYLFTGTAETADADLFTTVDARHRIFRARETSARHPPGLPRALLAAPLRDRTARRLPAARANEGQQHQRFLEKAAPPSALVDRHHRLVHLSESAGRYLEPSGGSLTDDAVRLVRPELRADLQLALDDAAGNAAGYTSTFRAVQFNGVSRRVAVVVQSPPAEEEEERQFLILFIDGGPVRREASGDDDSPPTQELVAELRQRLEVAERRVSSTRDDHHLVNEDLHAANEELQSLNEEYRATTEELETSKEELQSINEELQTVNHELKRKLEEVSTTNADLENLMAATDIPTLFLDADCHIHRFTPQLTRLFRVSARDIGRPVEDFAHRLDYDTLIDDARWVLREHQSLERSARSPDGGHYAIQLRPYRSAGGETDGVVVTFLDVTEQQLTQAQLQESRQQLASELEVMRRLHRMTVAVATAPTLEQALDQVLDGALDLHQADFGAIHFASGKAEEARLQLVAERGVGASARQALQSSDSSVPPASLQVLHTGRSCFVEDVQADERYSAFRDQATRAGYQAVHAVPLLRGDHELLGVLSMFFCEPRSADSHDHLVSDMLARPAADLIARRLHAEHASDLERQKSELHDRDEQRSEFIGMLGHELRNPLAAIGNSLELLSAFGSGSEALRERALGILTRQTAHMSRLISDLLDVTRLDRGKLHLKCEPVALARCLTDATEVLKHQISASDLQVKLELPDAPIILHADPDRLVQILENLLGNAVKFTPRQGAITVSARAEDKFARICVRDTGIGIASANLETLFNPYQQVDQKGTAGGLGLGLTLVKGLVESHGGTIEARSEGLGLGSEFILCLPLAARALRKQRAPARTPIRSRVLVVDDQPDVADSLAAMLQGLGQQVEVAYDGANAIAVAADTGPKLAIVDLSMPQMDGYEVAERLRGDHPDMMIVALTGRQGGKPGQQAAEAAVFDQMLLKPLGVDGARDLLRSLAEHMAP